MPVASPRRRAGRSALKYLNSVYVATIFTNLKRVLFDFAPRGAISCDCIARDRTQSLLKTSVWRRTACSTLMSNCF